MDYSTYFFDMNLNSLLTHESGRISGDIHQRTLNTNLWLDLVDRGTWEDEMGTSISVLTYEPTTPATSTAWTNIALNSDSNNCVPTADTIAFAQTLREYNLQQKALEGPPICLNDLRSAFKRKKQLENAFSVLTQNTRRLWEERHRSEYVRLAQHKVIATSALPEGTTTFPLTIPTSRLTSGILEHFYLELARMGADIEMIQTITG